LIVDDEPLLIQRVRYGVPVLMARALGKLTAGRPAKQLALADRRDS
jgi:hypothetical protein